MQNIGTWRSCTEFLTVYHSVSSKSKSSFFPGLTKDQITKFVEDNFEDAVELENWQPPDFTDRPALISLVADWKYQKWLLLLNQIWKQLGKKMDIDVLVNADRHSLIYVSLNDPWPLPYVRHLRARLNFIKYLLWIWQFLQRYALSWFSKPKHDQINCIHSISCQLKVPHCIHSHSQSRNSFIRGLEGLNLLKG